MPATIPETAIAAATRQAAAIRRRVALNDPGQPGLCLRITPGGIRTWSWVGRDTKGRVRRFGLGRYPAIGLREARAEARAMAEEVRKGADPVRDARAARAKPPKGHTLADLLTLYGRQVGSAVKSWPQMEAQIRRVFRLHLDIALAALTVGALQLTVDAHPKPKSASFGVRCLLTVARWACVPGRGYVTRELLDLRASAAKPKRDRVVSRDELAKLLPALAASDSPYAEAHRLILLTACRRGELTGARWQDVDFAAATWTLPATKNGKAHIIPLSRQALALLQARRSQGGDPGAPVFTSDGKVLSGWARATDRLQQASGTAGWTRHDLRHTAATMMGELGVIPDIVEAALNHVQIHSALAARYNAARYRPEVAVALQRLADQLDLIEGGGGNVVAFPLAVSAIPG
jgi:integrase